VEESECIVFGDQMRVFYTRALAPKKGARMMLLKKKKKSKSVIVKGE